MGYLCSDIFASKMQEDVTKAKMASGHPFFLPSSLFSRSDKKIKVKISKKLVCPSLKKIIITQAQITQIKGKGSEKKQ